MRVINFRIIIIIPSFASIGYIHCMLQKNLLDGALFVFAVNFELIDDSLTDDGHLIVRQLPIVIGKPVRSKCL